MRRNRLLCIGFHCGGTASTQTVMVPIQTNKRIDVVYVPTPHLTSASALLSPLRGVNSYLALVGRDGRVCNGP